MSRGRDNWYLEMEWPEPTQNTTIINNYYYYGGNNYVESEEYDEEWDGDDEYDDEDYDEDYDEDDEYDDEDYDEEDCEDDDYEVTNRNTNLPAAPVAPVVNNNIRVNSTTYSQTTYGDINVFIQNNPRIIEAARNSASIARMVTKVIDNVTNTDAMQQVEKYLANAAASAVITGRKEAAVVSLAADAIRKLSKQFIG